MAQIKTYLTKDGLASIDAGEAYFISTLGRARSIKPEKERKEIIASLLNAVRDLIISRFVHLERVRQDAVTQLHQIEEHISTLTLVSEHATLALQQYGAFLEETAVKNYDEDENEFSKDMRVLKEFNLEVNDAVEVYKDVDVGLSECLKAFHRMLKCIREMETHIELQLKQLDNELEQSTKK